ncbi:MAG TPA: hypothetical protein VFN67_36435 [Polyangiales bacterium]|nr:hypothetical protein [Polyangiales bacterium]
MASESFQLAVDHIDAIAKNEETPSAVRYLAEATRDALNAIASELADTSANTLTALNASTTAQAEAMNAQNAVRQQQEQRALAAPSVATEQQGAAEASPPPLASSIPPGLYEAPRNAAGQVLANPIAAQGYEPRRNADGEVDKT